ncbi:hypothetical protein SPSIL_058190 [Sporomusa silvacetica DSM 10669]|uniref:DUF2290 domain-containing protein n=1 Tax=Sporomusa silvacetica DSM 10669 TaxID=1123289 RepID=A0ABZ3IVK1_9FIRM|nr:DUF2290 domain-containing protein [Sporomusa silvacetica]OZC14233.1 hypothetical protein SPSIL_49600 [Sporomusa silvacetica DSM 10669]
MKSAAIFDAMNEVKKMLQSIELLKKENTTRPRSLTYSKFSEEFIKMSQDGEYEKIYQSAMKNADYDFVLKDDSFFQLSCDTISGSDDTIYIRYAYYPNPRYYCSYEQFLKTHGLSYEECDDSFLIYYEQEIAEARLKSAVTPIRYEYDLHKYVPEIHPISHLHIGHEEDMRIALSKIMIPQKFVSFVIRAFYYKKWKNAMQANDLYKEICRNAKHKCSLVPKDFFHNEKMFLYLE